MPIEMKTIRVNGILQECRVVSQPYPIGTSVFINDRWWNISSFPCEIADVVVGETSAGFQYVEFDMPTPKPGDFGTPVPIIYGEHSDDEQ